jgi:hypothetical protein
MTSTVYWPRDLLREAVPNARILTYGYNADVVSGFFRATNANSISQHGRDLMAEVERNTRNEVIQSSCRPSPCIMKAYTEDTETDHFCCP